MIHPVTLRFDDDALEEAFRRHDDRTSRRRLRLAIGLAILLYLAFSALDRLLVPELADLLLAVRFGICAILALVLVATYRMSFDLHRGLLTDLAAGVAGGGLLVFVAANPDRAAIYHEGLILSVIAIHAVFRPRLLHAVAISFGLIAAFDAVVLLVGEASTAELVRANYYLVGANVIGIIGLYSVERYARLSFARAREIEDERERSDRLLLNVLPEPIAERLKRSEGELIADRHEAVTVMFVDIHGFTPLVERMDPDTLIELLNRIFTEFDRIALEHGVEKIKSVGDAYMLGAGCPIEIEDHCERVAEAALAIRDRIGQFTDAEGGAVEVRIGIATGPVVAGVIGASKFAYDLWGDVVNTASRMQSHGEPGSIQVTEQVVRALGGSYAFRPRGEVEVKGKGRMTTWFLEGRSDAIGLSSLACARGTR